METPVKVTTAPYSGSEKCTKCGKRAHHRVQGMRGDLIARMILCRRCYREFQQVLHSYMGQAHG